MFSLLILILASEVGQSSKEERAIAIRTIMFWRIHVSVGQTVCIEHIPRKHMLKFQWCTSYVL